MITSLHQSQLVKNYYEEFLNQIKDYQNITRPSIFVKYFNINRDDSIHKEEAESTYDTYDVSKVVFDIYEYTPLFFIGPVSNSVANVPDLDGQRVDGTTTATLYTISRPRIGDLVSFVEPIQSGEIFRITGVRTSTNLIHSSTPAEWFEVDLDYAPVKDTSNLNIGKRFIYDLSLEQNILFSDYVERLNWLNDIDKNLKILANSYNIIEDYYCYDNLVPCLVNEIVILAKKEFNNRWLRLFEEIRSPFGYSLLEDLEYNSFSEISIDPQNNVRYVFNVDTNEKEEYILGTYEDLDLMIRTSETLHSIMVNSQWIKKK